MESEGNSSDVAGDPPKKKGLDISLFLGPTTDVQTSIGKIYLYPPRISDYTSFEKLSATVPAARFREFLPCVASLSATSKIEKERDPLALELVSQLSNEEVEALAETYASSSALQTARVGSKDKSGLPREEGEAATSYVARLIKKELEDHVDGMKRMREQMLASTSGIFDQVRKSSLALGSTLSAYEQLARDKVKFTLPEPNMDQFHAINEHHARLARERAEELEMVRLTGKMTAESAKTLQDLAEAASTLLENMDLRDRRSNRMTHFQLWIAVVSVVVAAILSGAAFLQDKENNTANDKLQEKILSSINEGNRQRTAIEAENMRLKARIDELDETVARLSSVISQPTAQKAKSADSAARRVTSPGKVAPQPRQQ